jgi:hypothetical protein
MHRSKQKSRTRDQKWYRKTLSLLLVCYYETLDANAVPPLREEPASLSTFEMVIQSSDRHCPNSVLSRVSSQIERDDQNSKLAKPIIVCTTALS